MSEEKKGWYVLRAISGKENKVKEVLDAEIKNTDLGNYVFQVLIPTEKGGKGEKSLLGLCFCRSHFSR